MSEFFYVLTKVTVVESCGEKWSNLTVNGEDWKSWRAAGPDSDNFALFKENPKSTHRNKNTNVQTAPM